MSNSQLIAWVLLGFGTAALTVTAVVSTSVFVLLRRRRDGGVTPPISILKPMKGLDDGLYENLRALALQDYPNFEILCGCADVDDPALRVAIRVQRELPAAKIRIFGNTGRLGYNPKVANLAALARHASFDHILISDSNVRPQPDYLRATAAELRPGVGLVANMLVGVGEKSVGALLENLHLASFIASVIAGAKLIARHPCVIGKSMLMRRSDLQRLGGFAAFKDMMGEDYLIGKAFLDAGFEVAISPHLLPTVSEERSLGAFANRHVRWTQLRRWINLPAYLGEPLLNPVPFFLAGAVAALVARDAALLVACLGGVTIKLTLDALLWRRLRRSALGWHRALWIIVKDIAVLALWVVGGLRRTVDWRGNVMRIGPLSRLEPLHERRNPRHAEIGERA